MTTSHSQTPIGEEVLGHPQIKYVDPSNQSHVEYFDHLQAYNSILQRKLSTALGMFIGDGGYSFNTTGSDARLEKGPSSLIELLVFTRSLPTAEQSELRGRLAKFIEDNPTYYVYGDVEIKDINSDDKISNTYIKREGAPDIALVSPNRIFDANFLAGDIDLTISAREITR